jgi:hypothetical protein
MRNAKLGMRNSGDANQENCYSLTHRYGTNSAFRVPHSEFVTSHMLIAYIKSVKFDYKSSMSKNNLRNGDTLHKRKA